jgi:hypothetical protein
LKEVLQKAKSIPVGGAFLGAAAAAVAFFLAALLPPGFTLAAEGPAAVGPKGGVVPENGASVA